MSACKFCGGVGYTIVDIETIPDTLEELERAIRKPCEVCVVRDTPRTKKCSADCKHPVCAPLPN
jgi:hypothetical protein